MCPVFTGVDVSMGKAALVHSGYKPHNFKKCCEHYWNIECDYYKLHVLTYKCLPTMNDLRPTIVPVFVQDSKAFFFEA